MTPTHLSTKFDAKTNNRLLDLRATLLRTNEALVWIIVLIIIIGVRLISKNIFTEQSSLWLAGIIIAFALIYYTIIYHRFEAKKRQYIKDIADVIFIGILILLARDYGAYFFTLYILPIAAAAMALNTLNSVFVATVASIFITANVILNTNIFGSVHPVYFGTFQIIFLLLLTFFTRVLAIQLRDERSERTFFEAQLREVDEKLQDIEAIEEEFVSITSHQLNTPLSIIRGYVSMLIDGDAGKLTHKQVRYARQIKEGSLRLSNIVQDLLNITHLDRDKILADSRMVDLNEVIRHTIEHVHNKLEPKQLKVVFAPFRGQAKLMGNAVQIEQIFTNLFDNAIKYSDSGKIISVTTARETNQKNEVIILFTDQGIGIPKSEQHRIFQRFYRATNTNERDTQGTGLGLYIVKRIVEAHGGAISFTSIPGKGTTFKIRLPLFEKKEKK